MSINLFNDWKVMRLYLYSRQQTARLKKHYLIAPIYRYRALS